MVRTRYSSFIASAALPRPAVPPSSSPLLSSPPGIHLSPPGPESLRDLRAREGGRRLEEKRKLFNDYFLLGRCMPESSASWSLSLAFLFLTGVGTGHLFPSF